MGKRRREGIKDKKETKTTTDKARDRSKRNDRNRRSEGEREGLKDFERWNLTEEAEEGN